MHCKVATQKVRLKMDMTRYAARFRIEIQIRRLLPFVARCFALRIFPTLFTSTLLVATGCKSVPPEKPLGTAIQIHAPLGLPPVQIPPDNPPTTETIALGRRLFYDAEEPVVSGGLACAGCHPDGRDDGHVWHEAKINTAEGVAVNFLGDADDAPEEDHVKGVPRRTPTSTRNSYCRSVLTAAPSRPAARTSSRT